ncbi:hypothetical protein ES332_A11G181300v1 [Gossypium tomentosum]|uniref:Uncharacterized protein n=1 Tax=Gossypium tomentosum TaxID=34277 RepID=A0A5D2NCS9_GOSTO|nr:hypothetical protein ES332_A11G181300v1 [Gossypium tomentosum]
MKPRLRRRDSGAWDAQGQRRQKPAILVQNGGRGTWGGQVSGPGAGGAVEARGGSGAAQKRLRNPRVSELV